MSTTPLGGTVPPGLFDDQPESVIFDRDGIITDAERQLHPFSSFAHMIRDDEKLDIFLQGKPSKKIILILLFSNQTRDNVITFVNDHIHQQQSIHSLYLFFINGQQHTVELQNLFTPLLIDCYSITDDLHSEIRDALSTASDLNARFCSRRVKEEKALGNSSVAYIYEQQYRQHVTFQVIHNVSILTEMNKDCR